MAICLGIYPIFRQTHIAGEVSPGFAVLPCFRQAQVSWPPSGRTPTFTLNLSWTVQGAPQNLSEPKAMKATALKALQSCKTSISST